MKFTHIFGIVISGHALLVAGLLVQPGCQSSSVPTRVAKTEELNPTQILRGPEAGPMRPRVAPTRPAASDPSMNDYVAASTTPITRRNEPVSSTVAPLEPLEPLVATDFEPFVPGPDADDDMLTAGAGFEPLPASAHPVINVSSPDHYTVRQGDTLSAIARRHSVSLAALLQANQLDFTAQLHPGDQLLIPERKLSTSVAEVRESAGAGESEYVVKPGDTLSHIARRYDVSVFELKAVNQLKSDRILVGQRLAIPETGATVEASVAIDRSARTIPDSYYGKVYSIRPGDTLGEIARRHGVRVGDLAAFNGISDVNRISVGRELKIPEADWTGRPVERSTSETRPSSNTAVTTQAQPNRKPASTRPDKSKPEESEDDAPLLPMQQASGPNLLDSPDAGLSELERLESENIPLVRVEKVE